MQSSGNSIQGLLWQAVIACCVTGIGLGVYDKYVRQPSTPRLAMVDIGKLYAQAEQQAIQMSLDRTRADDAMGASANPEFAASARVAASFGQTLELVMRDVSGECRCTIVTMAAIYGGDASIPDFTQAVAQRLQARLAVPAPASGAKP